MATNIKNKLSLLSGIVELDVLIRGRDGVPVNINATDATEEQWTHLGKFREGTFSPTGDEPTQTDLKYEDGVIFYSIPKNGTIGFDGNIPQTASELIKLLLHGEDLDVSAIPTDSPFYGLDGIAAGRDIANLDNIAVRFTPQIGDTKYILFPNVSMASTLNFVGTTDNVTDIKIKAKCLASEDTNGTYGHIFAMFKRNPDLPIVTTNPVTGITDDGATFAGKYVPGEAAVTAIGFEYKETSAPTWTSVAVTPLASPFHIAHTGLNADTEYFVRAFATIAPSTKTYGKEVLFTTLP